MHIAHALLKLARLDSSLLVALAVFVPLFARTGDLRLSATRAIPLLFIGMCTFIANDLDDVERDKINHPDRPLPSGHIAPSLAAVLYFILLGAALFSTRSCVHDGAAFWYYLLLTLSISYGYVVECFPGFKSLYVAGATSIPVLIVASFYPGEERLYLATGSVFFFVLGREICMDLADRTGDAASFMHRFEEGSLAVAAVLLQAIGLVLLAVQVNDLIDVLAVLTIAILLVVSSHYWFQAKRSKQAIFLMKLQLFVGLYFLA